MSASARMIKGKKAYAAPSASYSFSSSSSSNPATRSDGILE
jgi:hypothetical protein